MDGLVGDRVREDATCEFSAPDENKHGRRVVDICAERELCMENTQLI